MNDLKNNILHKIEAGEIAMRPHWQFVLLSVGLVIGVLFAASTLIYLASFVLYILQYSGAVYATQFGTAGLGAFLLSVPWRLAVLGAMLLVVLYVLVQRFAFSYHRPFVYTIVGVLLCVVASSIFIAQTSAHELVRKKLDERPLPVLAALYETDRPARQLTFGQITAVTDTGYTLTTLDGETLTVTTDRRTKQPADLTVDTHVVVLGERTEDTIAARGIRPAPNAPERLRALERKQQRQDGQRLLRPEADQRQPLREVLQERVPARN